MEIVAAAEPTGGKQARFVGAGFKEQGHMKAGGGRGHGERSDDTLSSGFWLPPSSSFHGRPSSVQVRSYRWFYEDPLKIISLITRPRRGPARQV